MARFTTHTQTLESHQTFSASFLDSWSGAICSLAALLICRLLLADCSLSLRVDGGRHLYIGCGFVSHCRPHDSVVPVGCLVARSCYRLILHLLLLGGKHFACAIAFVGVGDSRLVSLLFLVFVDPLEDTVHLLLEEQFKLFNHELVDGTSFDEVGDQAVHGVSLVDDDALDAEVRDVHVYVQLGFPLFNCVLHRVELVLVLCESFLGRSHGVTDCLRFFNSFGLTVALW